MLEFRISKDNSGSRLDHFLAAEVPHLSRSRIQNLIKAGNVLVNGERVKSGEKVRAGNTVTLHEPPAEPTDNAPEAIPLDVLFEDEDFLVLNKAPGMVVHPAAGNREHTLVNALLHHCQALSGIGGEQRPGIIHRLDKDTSGCIVVATNDRAHEILSRQFADRKVLKVYLALAQGRFKEARGLIDGAIGRHPIHRKKMAVVGSTRGRHASTDYRVLEELKCGSLVQCTLHTGRTHQIRVHLKHLGHPLLGDALYGNKDAWPRQMLHAWKLGLFHPRSGDWLEFKAPLPDDFTRTLSAEMISRLNDLR